MEKQVCYLKTTDDLHVYVCRIERLEKTIDCLSEQYHSMFLSKKERSKFYSSIEECIIHCEEIAKEKISLEGLYNKVDRLKKIKKFLIDSLINSIPHLVWIKVNDKMIGVETSDWASSRNRLIICDYTNDIVALKHKSN